MKQDPKVYDRIGRGYPKHRRADPRIAEALLGSMNLRKGSAIAEIGAGTGNYSAEFASRGFLVKAVEPSATMREQGRRHPNLEWFEGTAEAVPLPDASVDAAASILAFHHFSSPAGAFQEMARVCATGPIVLFTFDPRLIARPWLADYFPTVWDVTFHVFPPIAEVETSMRENMRRNVATFPYELPWDLQDLFVAAMWRRPELYLDPEIRACNSVFALLDQEPIEEGAERLEKELANGEWTRKHGAIQKLDRFDVGFRIVRAF